MSDGGTQDALDRNGTTGAKVSYSATTLARKILVRDSTPADAHSLAELIAIAGAGIPQWLWAQMASPNEDVLDVGIRRAKRDEGGFSWTNAVVAEVDGSVIGMILGYRLEDGDEYLDQLPEILRPFLELERRVPGSWYINAFALYTPWRGRGIGTRLLAAASKRARSRMPANERSNLLGDATVGGILQPSRIPQDGLPPSSDTFAVPPCR